MWKIRYMAPKGYRTNRGFRGVTLFSAGLWYSPRHDKWLTSDLIKGCYSSHHYKPKTLKAFKRYLRKHPELKGTKVVLSHPQHIVDSAGKHLYDLAIEATWEE